MQGLSGAYIKFRRREMLPENGRRRTEGIMEQAKQGGNERLVVKLLQKMNDLQLNIISVKTGIPIGQLSSLLFNLEMKGVVKPYAGGTYHLLG